MNLWGKFELFAIISTKCERKWIKSRKVNEVKKKKHEKWKIELKNMKYEANNIKVCFTIVICWKSNEKMWRTCAFVECDFSIALEQTFYLNKFTCAAESERENELQAADLVTTTSKIIMLRERRRHANFKPNRKWVV